MNTPLEILMLEDNPSDAEMIGYELRRLEFPFTLHRVEARTDFEAALREDTPDLILADYRLPAFDGLSALVLVRERDPDLPFLLVTGAMGEEWAVETLKKGANDYVLKDRLYKLPTAILVCCSRRVSPFTPEDLSTLEKLGDQVCVALENTRLIQDLMDPGPRRTGEPVRRIHRRRDGARSAGDPDPGGGGAPPRHRKTGNL